MTIHAVPDEPTDIMTVKDAYALSILMAEVLKGQTDMQETLTAILTKFEDLSTEIRPTLDSLTNHPLIKMLSKGK